MDVTTCKSLRRGSSFFLVSLGEATFPKSVENGREKGYLLLGNRMLKFLEPSPRARARANVERRETIDRSRNTPLSQFAKMLDENYSGDAPR